MLYNTFHNRWLRLIAAVAGEFIAALGINLFASGPVLRRHSGCLSVDPYPDADIPAPGFWGL